MGISSLNKVLWLRNLLIRLRRRWLMAGGRVVMDRSAAVSLTARLVATAPASIQIGPETLIAFKTLIYSRDPASGQDGIVRIGRRCFVGGGAIITPGVTIHDEAIVAAGAVVFDDVPPRCIVAGNPARVVRDGIHVGKFGRLDSADATEKRLRGQKVNDSGG